MAPRVEVNADTLLQYISHLGVEIQTSISEGDYLVWQSTRSMQLLVDVLGGAASRDQGKEFLDQILDQLVED